MRTRFVSFAAMCLFAASVPSMGQTKIAVANPIKILNELAETKDINKAMESEQATFKQQAGDREQKLKDVQAQRDALKSDSPQYLDLNKQLVTQRTEAQAWAQQTQLELGRKFRDQAKRMNDKITTAITEVAKAEGYDLVLSEQKPELTDAQMEQMNPQQLMSVLFGRNPLYKSDAIDVTQKIIAKLDAVYAAK